MFVAYNLYYGLVGGVMEVDVESVTGAVAGALCEEVSGVCGGGFVVVVVVVSPVVGDVPASVGGVTVVSVVVEAVVVGVVVTGGVLVPVVGCEEVAVVIGCDGVMVVVEGAVTGELESVVVA